MGMEYTVTIIKYILRSTENSKDGRPFGSIIASSDNIMYNYKEILYVFPFINGNTSRKLRKEMIVQFLASYKLIVTQVF